jgi:hypothetical protein
LKKFTLKIHNAFLLLAVVYALQISAQDSQKIQFGLTAGVNTSDVVGDGLGGFRKIGITAGVFAFKPISEKGNLEIQLLFFQKGSQQLPRPEEGIYDAYKLQLNYIDLPVFYVFEVSKWEVALGPSFGWLLSQKEEDFFGLANTTNPFNNFELAANAEIRWNPADNFRLALRYHLAILPSRHNIVGANLATLRGQHNQAILLSGAFIF